MREINHYFIFTTTGMNPSLPDSFIACTLYEYFCEFIFWGLTLSAGISPDLCTYSPFSTVQEPPTGSQFYSVTTSRSS